MKKTCICFFTAIIAVHGVALGAVTIKKAAPVTTQQTSAVESGASLLPTVLNIVSGVKQLNQQQMDLNAECQPTSSELDFVNKTIREWAKTGTMTADEVENAMGGMRRCENSVGYAASVRVAYGIDQNELICYDWNSDPNMVWYKFPVASKASYCTDGSISGCDAKNRKDVSNIYDVFRLVDFSQDDYTVAEAQMASKIIAKIEKCSYAKLSAKQNAMWGEFLVGTIGNLGKKTNTAAIMQTVSGVANTGGTGLLQSLGGIATQFMAQ